MAESSKDCTGCQEALPLSAFHKNRSSKDGRHGICKECRKLFPSYVANKWLKDDPDRARAYSRKWERKHRDKRNKKNREYRAAIKEEVFDHYGWKCTCCGETEIVFLTIDHINEDGASHRAQIGKRRCSAGSSTYLWITKNKFPDTFQTLCMNCNWAKSRGGCPHQNKSKLPLTQS